MSDEKNEAPATVELHGHVYRRAEAVGAEYTREKIEQHLAANGVDQAIAALAVADVEAAGGKLNSLVDLIRAEAHAARRVRTAETRSTPASNSNVPPGLQHLVVTGD